MPFPSQLPRARHVNNFDNHGAQKKRRYIPSDGKEYHPIPKLHSKLEDFISHLQQEIPKPTIRRNSSLKITIAKLFLITGGTKALVAADFWQSVGICQGRWGKIHMVHGFFMNQSGGNVRCQSLSRSIKHFCIFGFVGKAKTGREVFMIGAKSGSVRGRGWMGDACGAAPWEICTARVPCIVK